MYYDERQVFASTDLSKYKIPSVIATADGKRYTARSYDGETFTGAYTSLDFNEGTQKFCLLYEKGAEQNKYKTGIAAAEFDIEWLLS